MKRYHLLFVLVLIIISSCDFIDTSFKDTTKKTELSIIPFSNDHVRYGLVDLNGRIIVENEWENPSSIASDGIVRVKNSDGMYEFYTATENPKKLGGDFLDASLFSEGLAIVVNDMGFMQCIDMNGNIKFEFTNDGMGSSIIQTGVYSEGLVRFQNAEGLWGFMNTNGEVAISPRYDYVRSFHEGLAYVEKYNSSNNETSIGFINNLDEEIIPVIDRYTFYSDFSSGLAACTDKYNRNQWGYINKKGDRVIDINNTRVGVKDFQGDYAAFFDGSYWGLIDKTGEIVVNPKFDQLFSNFRNGLAPNKSSSNEIGFINANREEIIKNQYEEILPFYSKTTVVKDKYYIFVDKKGNSVSKTYLKDVPIKSVKKQYENLTSTLVRKLNINTNNIVNSLFQNIENQSFNGLSFNSGVIDVINYYKIPKSSLPQNSFKKDFRFKVDFTGGMAPCYINLVFDEPVHNNQNGKVYQINNRSRLKALQFKIDAEKIEEMQIEDMINKIIEKLEASGFEFNVDATNNSWKNNVSIYISDRTIVEIYHNSDEIIVTVDYSEYF